ncbi:MAG: sigma-54-dependent Fis family transcriptional regulator [Candidatus Aminicenantes bacterium]|nr:sigma-54-dependent Fis family transcriptional regulator [Candidatus Aminicenantes bacterium]
MIESIKNKLWNILKKKKVSLAMIYDREGEILWHKGRVISGKNIAEGEGFCRSYILDSLESGAGIDEENVIITSSAKAMSKSAMRLLVKSVVIQPVNKELFLYIDSGTKEAFSETEHGIFHTLGELLSDSITQIEKKETGTGGITGKSEEMKKIRDIALKYSLEEEPVLILGETGVGKSHIAELLHQYSGRLGKFVVVNTPTIQESLFESVMFGHIKGAFTDARFDRKGAAAEAEGGTIFIDEISEIPPALQTKMLRFIETRKYQVLGESIERKADVRILAATNKEMRRAIEKEEFREDLYFRLHVLEIRIPPLRERKEDLKELVMDMRRYLNGKEPGEKFWEAIFNHDWPGNVRELITVLKRAGIEYDSPITGREIEQVISQSSYKKSFGMEISITGRILKDLQAGKSFWEVVKKPFLNRDLNRSEVKEVMGVVLKSGGGKYKDVLADLNIEPEDYKKFLNFINDNGLKP